VQAVVVESGDVLDDDQLQLGAPDAVGPTEEFQRVIEHITGGAAELA
jgi:hypothetical protein